MTADPDFCGKSFETLCPEFKESGFAYRTLVMKEACPVHCAPGYGKTDNSVKTGNDDIVPVGGVGMAAVIGIAVAVFVVGAVGTYICLRSCLGKKAPDATIDDVPAP